VSFVVLVVQGRLRGAVGVSFSCAFVCGVFLVVCLCVLWYLFRRAGSSVVELSIAARRVTGSNPVSRLFFFTPTRIGLPITTSCHPPYIMHATATSFDFLI
jgi:hypothetical protein